MPYLLMVCAPVRRRRLGISVAEGIRGSLIILIANNK
jgi:hypothetical protein